MKTEKQKRREETGDTRHKIPNIVSSFPSRVQLLTSIGLLVAVVFESKVGLPADRD